jgi:hypothetical protein
MQNVYDMYEISIVRYLICVFNQMHNLVLKQCEYVELEQSTKQGPKKEKKETQMLSRESSHTMMCFI